LNKKLSGRQKGPGVGTEVASDLVLFPFRSLVLCTGGNLEKLNPCGGALGFWRRIQKAAASASLVYYIYISTHCLLNPWHIYVRKIEKKKEVNSVRTEHSVDVSCSRLT
jgi:hypothetical protein